MRKIVLSAALAGTAFTLSACGENAEVADPVEEEMTAGAEDTVVEQTSVMDANTATAEQLAGD